MLFVKGGYAILPLSVIEIVFISNGDFFRFLYFKLLPVNVLYKFGLIFLLLPPTHLCYKIIEGKKYGMCSS